MVTKPNPVSQNRNERDRVKNFAPHQLHPEVNREFINVQRRMNDVEDSVLQMTGGGTAIARVNAGAVADITVAFPGFGYQSSQPPTVSLVGGGGSGAKAVATISNGRITGVRVTSPGAGYTSPPSVVFSY